LKITGVIIGYPALMVKWQRTPMEEKSLEFRYGLCYYEQQLIVGCRLSVFSFRFLNGGFWLVEMTSVKGIMVMNYS